MPTPTRRRSRRVRFASHVEALECRRLLSGYDLSVVAAWDDVVAGGTEVSVVRDVTVGSDPAAPDGVTVAFNTSSVTPQSQFADAIFVADAPGDGPTGPIELLQGGFNPNREYLGPQLNENGELVYQFRNNTPFGQFDSINVQTLATGDSRLVVSDTNSQPTANFPSIGRYEVLASPSIADDGSVAWVGEVRNSFGTPSTVVPVLRPGDPRGEEVIDRVYEPALTSVDSVRVGDGGVRTFVYTPGPEQLRFGDGGALLATIAWSDLGDNPGIAGDGRLAAFSITQNVLNVTDGKESTGPGIFVAVADGSPLVGDPLIFRVAGVAGNGQLDPGETFEDDNDNGVFDPGEADVGPFAGFDVDSPIGVATLGAGSTGYTLAFLATPADGSAGGGQALYTLRLNTAATGQPTIERVQRVAGVGDVLPDGVGTIGNIRLHDPISDAGDLAFAVDLAGSGLTAAVLARPDPIGVFVVSTHGFGADTLLDLGPLGTAEFPIFGTTEFRDQFSGIVDRFIEMPADGSLFDGAIDGYAPAWASSDGWLAAITGRGLERFLFGAAFPAFATGNPSLAGNLLKLSKIFGQLAEAGLDKAEKIALKTADEVVARVVDQFPDPQATQDGIDKIHLVGHSRGGAVNAQAAFELGQLGYRVEQVTALDGYSTDWPFPAGFLGDIPIDDRITQAGDNVGRSVNYRVEDGLQVLAAQMLTGVFNSLTAKFGFDPVGSGLAEDVASVFLDARAPVRPAFDVNQVLPGYDLTVPGVDLSSGESNHITVTYYYANSGTDPDAPQPYIEDNFIGQNKDTPAGGAAPPPLRARGPTPANDAADPDAGLVPGVSDGGFQAIGALIADAQDTPVPDLGDDGFESILDLFRDPGVLLSQVWDFAGDVTLAETSPGDWAARVLADADGVGRLGQQVGVPAAASTLSFDLAVEDPGDPGDPAGRLAVTLGTDVLTEIDLAAFADGPVTLDVPAALAGLYADLEFVLIDAAAGAGVAIDDVRLTDGSDTTPPALVGGEYLFDTPLRPEIRLDFSEDVGVGFDLSDAAAITLTNLTTGDVYPAADLLVSLGVGGDSATVTLAGNPPADGNWRLGLDPAAVADAAGNALAGDATLDFFVLAGDFNRNRVVNTQDLLTVLQNFGTAQTLSGGDATYNGLVNTQDLLAVLQRFGQSLPPPAASLFGRGGDAGGDEDDLLR